MKKPLVIVMVLILSVSFAFSQEMELDTKKMDWGARLGTPVGVSARFMNEGKAIEFILGISNVSLINVTGLYEFHKPLQIGEIEGLSWFFGGGAHIGLISGVFSSFNVGIDGIIGVEYDMEPLTSLPISLTLDYKPALNLLGGLINDLSDAALTVHFTF
jgi:hypothetical protein